MNWPPYPRRGRSLPAIFAVPALLAGASVAGLILALLTDGPLDLLWSMVVAAPLLAIGQSLIRR